MAGATKLMTTSGGGVILTPATNIAADVTVNVPSQNCTLGIQGPAFSAYASANQSLSAGASTKIQMNTKEFDTANCYDTINYRFTPNVAGYYFISLNVRGNVSAQELNPYVYKNGSIFKSCASVQLTAGSVNTLNGSALVYMNGSTDYLECYCYSGANSTTTGTQSQTYWSGFMVRAA